MSPSASSSATPSPTPPRRGSRRSRGRGMASRWPRSTSRSVGRARSSAPASTACHGPGPPRGRRTPRSCSRLAAGWWSCASASVRSRRRRSARCWKRRGAASATSGSSSSRPEMAELRITGGELGGRRIRAPKGARLRPTTERVREAVFSILGDISDARVLDLFCGTGALAIEALSRGAAEATLVDTHPAAARRNLDALELSDRARAVRADAARFLRRADQASYDLVLCDPPYKLADRLAGDLDPLIRDALAAGARAMTDPSPVRPLELSLPLLTERTYGDTLIRIYESAR